MCYQLIINNKVMKQTIVFQKNLMGTYEAEIDFEAVKEKLWTLNAVEVIRHCAENHNWENIPNGTLETKCYLNMETLELESYTFDGNRLVEDAHLLELYAIRGGSGNFDISDIMGDLDDDMHPNWAEWSIEDAEKKLDDFNDRLVEACIFFSEDTVTNKINELYNQESYE